MTEGVAIGGFMHGETIRTKGGIRRFEYMAPWTVYPERLGYVLERFYRPDRTVSSVWVADGMSVDDAMDHPDFRRLTGTMA